MKTAVLIFYLGCCVCRRIFFGRGVTHGLPIGCFRGNNFQIRSDPGDFFVNRSIILILFGTQKERLEVEFIKLSESHDLIRRAVNLERIVEVILLPKEITAKTPRKNLERRYVILRCSSCFNLILLFFLLNYKSEISFCCCQKISIAKLNFVA